MPTKKQLIAKLHEDAEVHDTFIVLQKQLSPTRTGRSYLRVTLGDRSGQLEARVWEGAEDLNRRFGEGELVYVTGTVTSYQGVLQIKAKYIEAAEEGDVDWSQYLPSAERPLSEMMDELRMKLEDVENPYLKALLNTFLDDPDFCQEFSISPAAKGMHHAYIGGLLEHTLGAVKLAFVIGDLYPVNTDLLVTGAFMHDLGKMRELKPTAGFDYTLEGRFVGHIVIGRDILIEKAAKVEDFPQDLLMRLEHMILSHHGELEWGSPKRPQTIEAMALHMVDNFDAKMMAVWESISRTDGQSGDFTGYQRMFERSFYRVPVDEGGVPAAPPKTAAPVHLQEEPPSLPEEGPEKEVQGEGAEEKTDQELFEEAINAMDDDKNSPQGSLF